MDSQMVEIAGRQLLTAQLIAGNVEVATPLRDRGIDLIAYLDRKGEDQDADFLACPIQMKAFSQQGFGLDRKYERIAGLLIAYVWSVQNQGEAKIYAMTYKDALGVLDKKGYSLTNSWKTGGKYHVSKPGKDLLTLMKPYEMEPEKWTSLVRSKAKLK